MIKCSICECEVENIDEAIQKDWIPSYWLGSTEMGPACPNCCQSQLQKGADGEMEYKDRFSNLN